MSLIKNETEIAKIELVPVTSLENVYADTEGNLYRKRKSGLLKLSPCNNGRDYLQVCIDHKFHLAHRLVLTAWVGECPKDFNADHIDHDTTNNHPSNLRWIHKKMNYSKKVKHTEHVRITEEQRIKVEDLLYRQFPAPQIEKLTGVKRSNVYNIKYRNFL